MKISTDEFDSHFGNIKAKLKLDNGKNEVSKNSPHFRLKPLEPESRLQIL